MSRTPKSLPWRPRNADDLELLREAARQHERSNSGQIRKYIDEGLRRDGLKPSSGEDATR